MARSDDRVSTSSDATTTAVLGGRLSRRLDGIGVGIKTLDPDYRQDDDCCGFARLTAEAHNAPFVVRKFDDGAHQLPPPLAGARCSDARSGITPIKRYARLTLR